MRKSVYISDGVIGGGGGDEGTTIGVGGLL